MNVLQVGTYALTGKVIGKLPFAENAETALRAAEEGIVLLKNDGILPLRQNKVALFGAGSRDTTVCGTGSGFAFSPYTVSVYEGLRNNGIEITSELWLKNYEKYRKEQEKKGSKLSFLDKRFSGMTVYVDPAVIRQEELDDAAAAETAIYVIKRNTGEGFDRKPEKGDYYLSDNEKKNIELISERFEKIIVVLNTCVIDCSWLNSNDKINGIILLGQAGMEAGNALGKIITGKISPSGRLTDTFALSYEDYPASKSFSGNDGDTLQEDYEEDIYVGYRYFDSKKLNVVYPFGYGLSYTSFKYENISLSCDWNNIQISLYVVNEGTVPSKDVVQVYVSAPVGKLNKPYQELKGYAKTEEINPGEKERVTIRIPTATLSSYDMDESCWLMEKGKYLIRLGNHSRNTDIIGAVELDEDAVTIKTGSCFKLDRNIDLLKLETFDTSYYSGNTVHLTARNCQARNDASEISHTLPCYVLENYQSHSGRYAFPWKMEEKAEMVRKVKNATLLDVADSKITMEEFIATLDDEVLVRLVTGSGQETKHVVNPRLPKGSFRSVFNGSASGKTTNLFSESLGIPACSLADGPAGLHLMGTPTSSFPVGMVLAQTFNNGLIYKIGDCYGKEMEKYNVAICLGPGMNIHRDPLCGRNFEYYSEDPLITGNSAANFINGLQLNHEGYGVAAKHFCCNNQESDRNRSNSTVSERALREIYLKGFEIAVRDSQPLTVMSSYNLLNGIHTSSRYDLLTDVLRGEWGFRGFVMTDWDGESDRVADLTAGNDIIMGGYTTDVFIAAMNDIKPEFNNDGSVKQKKIAMYGGVMNKMLDMYNSFLISKDGNDTVTAAYTVEPGEKVKELCEKGICTINETEKTVTYRGFDRAYSLKRSVLQRNAIRILNYLAFGAPMQMAKRK